MSALNDAAAAAGFFSVLAGLAKQWVAVACLLTLAAALWIGCEVCDRKAARYLEEL